MRSSFQVQRTPDGRGGFVLPVALIVMVVLSMIVSAGLYSARSDLRSAVAARQGVLALVAADAGAARTMATWATSVPTLPQAGDSLVFPWQSLPDGSLYRIVVYRPPLDLLRPPSDRVVLYSTGRVAPPGQARRTIAVFLEPGAGGGGGALCCDAGFKVGERLMVRGDERNDPIPEIDGRDRHPPGWPAGRCTAPLRDVPGVRTSSESGVRVQRNGDVAGAPPILEDADVTPADFTDFGSTTYAELVAAADIELEDKPKLGGARPRTLAGFCDTTARDNWGSPLDPNGPCGEYFPVIHVAGDLEDLEEGQGQGILLVDEDLRLEGDFVFYGLVIVLGTVRLEDQSRIVGGLMARGDANGRGMNDVRDEAKLGYSSCAVARAQAGLEAGGSGVTAREASPRSWFEVIG